MEFELLMCRVGKSQDGRADLSRHRTGEAHLPPPIPISPNCVMSVRDLQQGVDHRG